MSPHLTTVEEADSLPSSNGAPVTEPEAAQAPVPEPAAQPSNGSEVHETEGLNGSTNGHANGHANGNDAVNGAANGAVNGAVNGSANGTANGHATPQKPKSPYLKASNPEEVFDLVCAGFGPSSLAIAVALHDALEAGTMKEAPRVLFLEKQAQFAWHAGMLLPGAKMQISFIKDLVSLRNPRSHFTFLNYVHCNGRLVEFTNLDTFLPARAEYEDYLRWSASHFEDLVKYQNEVVSVAPIAQEGPLKTFEVTARSVKTGATSTYRARNVLVAVGGQPSIPKFLPAQNPRIVHSSQYSQVVPKVLNDLSAPVRVAVIGGGQSSAEIFNNIQTLYPNSKTYLIMKSEFLRPSDDSPFVNSVFNPSFIDTIFPKSSAYRKTFLHEARATNYGVVRLQLIEHLYERMYHQHRELGPNEKNWPHRILGGRRVVNVEENGDKFNVRVCYSPPGEEITDGPLVDEEVLDVDLIIAATGYKRTAHVDLLKETWPLLPTAEITKDQEPVGSKDRWLVETEVANAGETETPATKATRILEVGRNYAVRFTPDAVAPGSGIWLQGCNEGTHGLSDTLLSVLGPRSGEMVESIFGQATAGQ